MFCCSGDVDVVRYGCFHDTRGKFSDGLSCICLCAGGVFRADNLCGWCGFAGGWGMLGAGVGCGMHGKGAKTGLESRGGVWVVWFIVLCARSDSRGVFGAICAVAGFGGGSMGCRFWRCGHRLGALSGRGGWRCVDWILCGNLGWSDGSLLIWGGVEGYNNTK